MAGEDGEGAVDLLGEDGAGELMGQGDGAEGKGEAGAGEGGLGPAVGGTDGEDDGLRAGVAEAAEAGGEVWAGELAAAAVEQDEDGGGARGLAIERGEQSGFRGVGVGIAGQVVGGAGEVVGGEGSGGAGFGLGTGWGDGGERELHGVGGQDEGIKVITGTSGGKYDLLDCDIAVCDAGPYRSQVGTAKSLR